MYGGGLSIDQLLTPQLGVFVRAGVNQIESISRTFFAASGGLRWTGPLWNRPRDRMGVGYSFQRDVPGDEQVKQIADVGRYPWGVRLPGHRPALTTAIRLGAPMPAVVRPARPHYVCLRGRVDPPRRAGGWVRSGHQPATPGRPNCSGRSARRICLRLMWRAWSSCQCPRLFARPQFPIRAWSRCGGGCRPTSSGASSRKAQSWLCERWVAAVAISGWPFSGAGRWKTCGRRSGISSHHSVP